MPDQLDVEVSIHREFGEQGARFVAGREGILGTVAKYLAGTSPHPLDEGQDKIRAGIAVSQVRFCTDLPRNVIQIVR
jgi:hypothetical protein